MDRIRAFTLVGRRHVHADRRPFLQARGPRSQARCGPGSTRRDFVEVETGDPAGLAGQRGPSACLRTELIAAGRRRRHALSAHLAGIRLQEAAGGRRDAVFEFARVFRNRERGALHQPGIHHAGMVPGRRAYDVLMEDCAALLALAAEAAGTRQFSFRGRRPIRSREPERLTVAAAFDRFAGIDLLATLVGRRGRPRRRWRGGSRAGVRIADDDTWSDIFSQVLVEHVEPHLGQGRATILYEYPAPEAALARASPPDPRVAERFELYACGVELANGFGELTDAGRTAPPLRGEMDEKQRALWRALSARRGFSRGLAQMPEASGVALGFDRLVMLATGAPRIDQVLWTPPAEDA